MARACRLPRLLPPAATLPFSSREPGCPASVVLLRWAQSMLCHPGSHLQKPPWQTPRPLHWLKQNCSVRRGQGRKDPQCVAAQCPEKQAGPQATLEQFCMDQQGGSTSECLPSQPTCSYGSSQLVPPHPAAPSQTIRLLLSRLQLEQLNCWLQVPAWQLQQPCCNTIIQSSRSITSCTRPPAHPLTIVIAVALMHWLGGHTPALRPKQLLISDAAPACAHAIGRSVGLAVWPHWPALPHRRGSCSRWA